MGEGRVIGYLGWKGAGCCMERGAWVGRMGAGCLMVDVITGHRVHPLPLAPLAAEWIT